jgi:hypothetical protein
MQRTQRRLFVRGTRTSARHQEPQAKHLVVPHARQRECVHRLCVPPMGLRHLVRGSPVRKQHAQCVDASRRDGVVDRRECKIPIRRVRVQHVRLILGVLGYLPASVRGVDGGLRITLGRLVLARGARDFVARVGGPVILG